MLKNGGPQGFSFLPMVLRIGFAKLRRNRLIEGPGTLPGDSTDDRPGALKGVL